VEYVSSVIINIRQLSLAVTPSLFLSGSYSNLSLLYVTGLIRLDPSIEATSTAVTMPRKKFEKYGPPKNNAKRRSLLQRSISKTWALIFLRTFTQMITFTFMVISIDHYIDRYIRYGYEFGEVGGKVTHKIVF